MNHPEFKSVSEADLAATRARVIESLAGFGISVCDSCLRKPLSPQIRHLVRADQILVDLTDITYCKVISSAGCVHKCSNYQTECSSDAYLVFAREKKLAIKLIDFEKDAESFKKDFDLFKKDKNIIGVLYFVDDIRFGKKLVALSQNNPKNLESNDRLGCYDKIFAISAEEFLNDPLMSKVYGGGFDFNDMREAFGDGGPLTANPTIEEFMFLMSDLACTTPDDIMSLLQYLGCNIKKDKEV